METTIPKVPKGPSLQYFDPYKAMNPFEDTTLVFKRDIPVREMYGFEHSPESFRGVFRLTTNVPIFDSGYPIAEPGDIMSQVFVGENPDTNESSLMMHFNTPKHNLKRKGYNTALQGIAINTNYEDVGLPDFKPKELALGNITNEKTYDWVKDLYDMRQPANPTTDYELTQNLEAAKIIFQFR